MNRTDLKLVLYFIWGMVAGTALLTDAFAELYPAPVYNGPSPQPSFPVEFAAYDPPVIETTPASGTPEIAEWTRQNQPGDTMALTGEDLSIYTDAVSEGRDTRFVFYGEGYSVADGLIQRLDGRQCVVALPADLPPDEMYLMWPRNELG